MGPITLQTHVQVQLAFKKFLRSWHQFYEANRGEIPVECQAGRQQVGLEAQQTHLAKIEDGSLLPLRLLVVCLENVGDVWV